MMMTAGPYNYLLLPLRLPIRLGLDSFADMQLFGYWVGRYTFIGDFVFCILFWVSQCLFFFPSLFHFYAVTYYMHRV